MKILTDSFSALSTVLFVGLLLGAGLPALFSFGLSSLYSGQQEADGAVALVKNPLRQIAGWLSFAVVVAVVAFGIAVIVLSGSTAGKELLKGIGLTGH